MSTSTTPTARVEAEDQALFDAHTELFQRYLQVSIADSTRLPSVPEEAVFFLVPDDEPAFAERVIAMATASVRHGHDVYLHHVRVVDLPELPNPERPIGTEPGTRRATYDPDTGDVLTNQVLGEDGEWHDTDEPLPTPRDDESDPRFRF